MLRILDDDSTPIELILVNVGDEVIYKDCHGRVSKIAVMKSDDFENYYFRLECGKTFSITK